MARDWMLAGNYLGLIAKKKTGTTIVKLGTCNQKIVQLEDWIEKSRRQVSSQ